MSRAEFIRLAGGVVGGGVLGGFPGVAHAKKKLIEVEVEDEDEEEEKKGLLDGVTGIFKKKPYKRRPKVMRSEHIKCECRAREKKVDRELFRMYV